MAAATAGCGKCFLHRPRGGALPHHGHRSVGLADEALRDAADDLLALAGEPAVADEDGVGADLPGVVGDGVGGPPEQQLGLDREVAVRVGGGLLGDPASGLGGPPTRLLGVGLPSNTASPSTTRVPGVMTWTSSRVAPNASACSTA
jgi:hypothetical protein